MSRYFTRAAKPLYVETPLWPDSQPLVPGVQVADHEAAFTGLLDAKGEEIWRQPNPMGFGKDRDW